MDGRPTLLVNGQPDTSMPVDDRGCQYGDGVFRTLRIDNGQPCWWPDQYAKLRHDADRLGIPCPDACVWESDQSRLLAPGMQAVLKLVLTRGSGPRGYRPPAAARPNRMAVLAPLPVRADHARLRVCRLRLSEQPSLAGIKHLNRLEQVLARGEWDDPDIDEGLLMAADGRLVGAVSANLFILREGVLLTPPLDRCGVAGVARARVLRAAVRLGLEAREADFDLDALRAAQEVMLTSSLVGVWPVERLEDRLWTDHPVARALGGMMDGL